MRMIDVAGAVADGVRMSILLVVNPGFAGEATQRSANRKARHAIAR
ncbi:MAG: hypothetical protein WBO55_02860 [Rhizobiaceae bacterium]